MKSPGKIKNILVATDFSPNACLAAHFAAEIARHVQARLILFHAFYPFFIWDEDKSSPAAPLSGDMNSVESNLKFSSSANLECEKEIELDPEVEVQKRMDTLAHELHQQFGISVSRLIKPGFAADEVPALATQLKADLVVLGARGTDYQEDKLFGEVSSDLLSSPAFPLLCVPPDFRGSFHEKIANLLQQKRSYTNVPGHLFLTELSRGENPTQQTVKKAV